MTITCEFCNKKMSNIGNLTRHQKSKSCLKIRDCVIDSTLIENRFQCEYCFKYMCDSTRLRKHHIICIGRYKKLCEEKDKEIEDVIQEKDKLLVEKDIEHRKLLQEKDKKIIELEKEVETIRLKTENEILRKSEQRSKEFIERIAEQPRTTNHTNNNNSNSNNSNNLVLPMIDTSQERIERIVQENYTENHFWDGQKGVAHFTKDNLLCDSENNVGYICTDASRKTFKRKGVNGEIIKDLKAIQLTQNISGPIRKKACEHVTNIIEKNPNLLEPAGKKFFDVDNIHRDNSGFITELACLTSI